MDISGNRLLLYSLLNTIIVGDFNFPEIDWDAHHSINNSFGSAKFLNIVQKLLLLQHVDFPTRARGSDTPHTS